MGLGRVLGGFFEDFEYFDWIITMDENNFSQVTMLDQNSKFKHKIRRMTDFCQITKITSVPDPYYGGKHGFLEVYQMLEKACEKIANQIE